MIVLNLLANQSKNLLQGCKKHFRCFKSSFLRKKGKLCYIHRNLYNKNIDFRFPFCCSAILIDYS